LRASLSAPPRKADWGAAPSLNKDLIPSTTIRLDPNDIALAKAQARRKRLRYQTYLKVLLREALLKEQKRSA
jgi:predicted DNA binding CopG/RHH family protein